MPTKKVSKSKSAKASPAKTSKKPRMKEGYAYCLRCKKQTKMTSMKTRQTKNGRTLMYGPGECGHEVFRLK